MTRPRALTAVVAVSLVLAWLNGLAARWFFVDFQLFEPQPGRDDYLTGSGACLGAALLLSAAAAVLLAVRGGLGLPAGLVVTATIGALSMALLSAATYDGALRQPSEPDDRDFLRGVGAALVWPGSWLLWVVLPVLLVLAWRRRHAST